MQQMLRALDHRRTAGLLGDIDESLDAQEPRAEVLRDAVEQELRLPRATAALSRASTKLSIALPSR